MRGRFGLGRFVLLFVKVALDKKLEQTGGLARDKAGRQLEVETDRKLEFS